MTRWNGYGMSWWRCKCGAARRVESLKVGYRSGDMSIAGPGIIAVNATPCKRCGTTDEPDCIGDPFDGFSEVT